ncbi:MAG: hemK [Cyanobacteria bacterium RYN_339]|nr:hemK [Cyanobacteria bacterium RYN_339]
MPTIGDALYLSSRQLLDAGIDTGSLEASLLLGLATGLDRLRLINRTAETVGDAHWDQFQALLQRRLRREPLQYILGETEFMGLPLTVNPDVLIPRADTEILVEAILDIEEERGSSPLVVADIGTGSGAIAIVLAKSLPYLEVIATDISPEALVVARLNAEHHGVSDQIDFRLGDGLAPLTGKVHYLVSNPPYVAQEDIAGLEPEVRDWEPRGALTPGTDPLRWYRTFAVDGAALVESGGMLAVEVGMGQARDVVALLEALPEWHEIEVREDLGKIERVVLARRR